MAINNFNLFSNLTPKASTYYMSTTGSIRQALEKFDFHKFTVVPLLDEEGNYISTVSEGDLLRYIKQTNGLNLKKLENVLLKDIEHYRPYKSLRIDCDFKEILDLAQEQNFIPIVDDRGKFIGILKRKTILQYLIENTYPLIK